MNNPMEKIVKLFYSHTLHDAPTKKLERVTVQERSHGMHDLHGVPDDSTLSQKETPEVLQRKLQEMDQHIQLLLSSSSNAANNNDTTTGSSVLKHTNPNYIQWLKLPCLRCQDENLQNPSKAVDQLVRVLEVQREVFGLESLRKGFITQKDLSNEDQAYLKTGYLQILSERDRAGRAILFIVGKMQKMNPVQTTLRLYFFLFMAALLDEEIQKRGFVIIYYGIGQGQFLLDRVVKVLALWWALPARLAAGHMCYDNPFLHNLVHLSQYSMSTFTLLRFRAHHGTHIECLYNLMTFGIPKHVLPIDSDGAVYTKDFEDWLESLSYLHDRPIQNQSQKEQPQRQQEPFQEEKQEMPFDSDGSLNTKDSDVGLDSNSCLHDQQQQNHSHEQQPQLQQQLINKEEEQPSQKEKQAMSNNVSSSLSDNATKGDKESSSVPSLSETLHSGIIVVVPGPMDILIGRGHDGPNGRNSMGNLRLRQLVEEYRPRYDTTTKVDKTVVTKLIVKKLQDAGCRFLVQNKQEPPKGNGGSSDRGVWTVATDAVAREKISNTFRGMRKTPKLGNAGTKKGSSGKRRIDEAA